jgi:predicted SAM-dependent methyltransferase
MKQLLKAWFAGICRLTGLKLDGAPHRVKEKLLEERDAVRRALEPALLRFAWKLKPFAPKAPVRLQLACGSHALPGFINIDWRETTATDLLCDIRRLPFPAGSVTEIQCYHALEHFNRKEAERAVEHWASLLAPGGKLVLEVPDFAGLAKRYLKDRAPMWLDHVFGYGRFVGDLHKWGYTAESLRVLLEGAGLVDVITPPAQDYHSQTSPCLRVEGAKPSA